MATKSHIDLQILLVCTKDDNMLHRQYTVKDSHKSALYFLQTTNSGPATDYEERPPVEPFVPSLEVKNRCQPDFSDLIGKVGKNFFGTN